MSHHQADSARPKTVEFQQFQNVHHASRLLTSADVADLLRTTCWQVNDLVRTGRLRCIQVGERTRRFRPDDVHAFIKEMAR